MKYLFSILLLASFLSCSEYQKALKTKDIAGKFKIGDSLYKEGKFQKANKIFAQIVPNYRGKPQAEKLMFLYSDTFYKMKDYYVAGYQFERFVSSYPKSQKKPEAAFLSAKSYYMLSPAYSKEQKETVDAIEKLQDFIDVFSNSEHVPEANKMIKELEFKLGKKAFEIAKQYNTIEDYEASIKSFENFMFNFPGSALREDALYYKFDSAYKLAINSVEYKKRKRLLAAKEYYATFKNTFGSSKYLIDAEKMVAKIENELKTYSEKS